MARKRDTIPHPGTYRRSLLQSYHEDCPRRERFNLQAGDVTSGYSDATALLGQAVHQVLHKIMLTLRATGEVQMPTQEAVEVMYEVMATNHLVLPVAEQDDLRWMVLRFCEYKWTASRIMALEDLLWQDLTCPDGKVRTLTGRPDLIVREGRSLVIVDYKSGRGKPRSPRSMPPEGEPIVGLEYLSEHGLFQLKTYGFLALRQWPAAEYVTLKELHLRSGEVREGTLGRAALEHVERQLAGMMQKVDLAIVEGPKSELWRPKPGTYCARQCPVARSCPIPREMRGVGAIESEAQARDAAGTWAVVRAQDKQLRDQLKAWHEATGDCPPVGGGKVVRWKPPVGKGRSFDFHWPEEPGERGEAA